MKPFISIIIRFEIKKGAPFIPLEFEKDSSSDNLKPLSSVLAMSSIRRPVKNSVKPSLATGESAPPTIPDNKKVDRQKITPTQVQCFGERKYSEVVIESIKSGQLSEMNTISKSEPLPTSSSSSSVPSSLSANSAEPMMDDVKYFSGNSFVEKTSGVIHFYKHSNPSLISPQCSMLCMVRVPAFLTCRELLSFVSPTSTDCIEMKIVRDSTPNQYMVLLKFQSHDAALAFYEQYNGIEFNSIEEDKCNLLFIERIETTTEDANGSLPIENLIELPTCAVCLERMDEEVITIFCNHKFHFECLQQWADTTCPVCRHNQTPELKPDHKCSECGKTTDLWMCLICGNVGCGRYESAHANRHFEATSHTFTLQIGGNLVWDYAGDNYVHRLIQSATDGKVVEHQGRGVDPDRKPDEKIDAIQLEYTYLLTNQLESQRLYFEELLRQNVERMEEFEKMTTSQIEALQTEVQLTKNECNEMKEHLAHTNALRTALEKKYQQALTKIQKLQSELQEEKQMCQLARNDKDLLVQQKAHLESLRTKEINDLQEQIRDLMFHFEAQQKLQDELQKSELTTEELTEGTVEVKEKPGGSSKGKKRNKK
uniref:BRCA1-associated protein n=1 Tax=Acrobeloides nanus TaxID=290746 RepID=A0A914DKN8_9BILA